MTRVALVTRIPLEGPRQGDRNRLLGLYEAASRLFDEVEVIVIGADSRLKPMRTESSSLYLRRKHGLWSGESFDGVIAFQLGAAPSALSIPAPWRVLDLTDSLDWYRQGLGRRPAVWVKRATLWRVGQDEVRWGSQFDAAWVSAKPDADWLRRLGLKSHVVPNGTVEKKALPPAEPRQLLMVGNLAYLPNHLGLTEFLANVWPHLHQKGYRLTLVGKGSGRKDWPTGVRGLGFQAHLEPLYEIHGVAISPVKLGAGSQSKIFEAMGFSRPVVAHREGIPGLPERVRAAVLAVDDSPLSWLSALESLGEPNRYREATDAGFAAVPRFSDNFHEALLQFLKGAPSA